MQEERATVWRQCQAELVEAGGRRRMRCSMAAQAAPRGHKRAADYGPSHHEHREDRVGLRAFLGADRQ